MTPTIDRYLDLWRPALREPRGGAVTAGDKRPDHNFLWINGHSGAPLKKLADRIVEVMRRELGRHFNVHLFRKVAPTELAIRDPKHVGVAKALLGHARYDTTETYYNLGQSIDAARTVHATLASLRPPASAPWARQPYIKIKTIGDKP